MYNIIAKALNSFLLPLFLSPIPIWLGDSWNVWEKHSHIVSLVKCPTGGYEKNAWLTQNIRRKTQKTTKTVQTRNG